MYCKSYFCRMILLQYWREWVFGAFCLVTLIQIIYYAAIFSRLAFFKPKPKLHSEQRPFRLLFVPATKPVTL